MFAGADRVDSLYARYAPLPSEGALGSINFIQDTFVRRQGNSRGLSQLLSVHLDITPFWASTIHKLEVAHSECSIRLGDSAEGSLMLIEIFYTSVSPCTVH